MPNTRYFNKVISTTPAIALFAVSVALLLCAGYITFAAQLAIPENSWLASIAPTLNATVSGLLWLLAAAGLYLAQRASNLHVDPITPPHNPIAKVTLEAIHDGVIAIDQDAQITFMNKTAQAITGWSRDDATGQPLSEVFRICSGSESNTFEHPADPTLQRGHTSLYQGSTLVISKSGQTHPIDSAISPIRDEQQTIVGAVITFRDVTRERDLSRKLTHQARHDALTDLHNRSEFEYRLDQLCASSRDQGRHHAMMYIDLDQFKVVNDTCGHMAGDALLKQLSGLLKNNVRKEDTLARLGGDEFGVLLESCSEAQAKITAEKLLYNIQAYRFQWQEKTFTVGASIGLVNIHEGSHGVAALLAAADTACYAAKDAGRNRVVLYHEDNDKLAQRDGEMQWVSRISQALEDDAFSLLFQSITPVDDPTQRGIHYEVLLRMNSDNGPISAGAFLPAAERYSMMGVLDRWVLSRSLLWLRHHPQHLQTLQTCSINLSGQSVGDENFLKFVSDQFRIMRVPAHKICFEITETAIISDLSNAKEFISTLKSLGCQFALDDFGSGLSSFAYLRDLEVDYLKIDGVFIRDMLNNPIDKALVESISQIGHVMNKKIVAEFVEHTELLETLQACGVDYVQGYAIDAPSPLDELLALAETDSLAS